MKYQEKFYESAIRLNVKSWLWESFHLCKFSFAYCRRTQNLSKKSVFIFVFRKETWKILYSAVILFVREKRGEKSSSKFNFEFFVNFLGMQGIWTVAFHWSRGFWVETTHANVLCNLKVQWMNLFSSTVNSFEVIYSFFFLIWRCYFSSFFSCVGKLM